MSLRMETLACLKERLMNRGPAGRVFASAQAQQEWLLGVEGMTPGLMRDPKNALASSVSVAADAASLHQGVAITEGEESEIKKFLDKVFFGNARLVPQLSGAQSDGIALSCPDPSNPNCWY